MIETPHDKGIEPPMVSVVIPTRNRREVLEKCLKALAVQTYPNYEVIVVDDGSSDDTQAFLQQHSLGDLPQREPSSLLLVLDLQELQYPFQQQSMR